MKSSNIELEIMPARSFQDKGVHMISLASIKNRLLAKINTRFQFAADRFTDSYQPVIMGTIPWTPVSKPLEHSKLALVTTAGVHHRDQEPFDMTDRDGDPTFRIIDTNRPASDLKITHDYYDHKDADRDINIVFPIERIKELQNEEVIGEAARYHYGFMGHIVGPHINVLMKETAPKVARNNI